MLWCMFIIYLDWVMDPVLSPWWGQGHKTRPMLGESHKTGEPAEEQEGRGDAMFSR